MIRFVDSLQLAYTKIRTRRIRLFIVLFVSSLLFTGLVAGSLIVSGALSSFRAFSDQGFTGRYLVSGTYADSRAYSSGPPSYDPAMIARAETLEKDLQARKKTEAKRLGIEYVTNEADRTVYDDGSGNKSLNTSTTIGEQVLQEFEQTNSYKLNLDRFKKQLPGAKKYYVSKRISSNFGQSPVLNFIDNNKEQTDQQNKNFMPGMTQGIAGLSTDWTLMDSPLLEPFLLKDQTLTVGTDGSIPIVTSYSAAQELLKLPKLSVNATANDKKARLVEVREKIAGHAFSVCYRNSTSNTDLQDAVLQQADIKANQNKKDYQKPEYITAPNTAPCAAPVAQRDVRTAETKKLADKQQEFDRIFGKPAPVAKILTFRIVGVSPDRGFPQGFSVNDILASILTSSLGVGWASPIDVAAQVPETSDIFKQTVSQQMYAPQTSYYAEYSDATQARTAFKEQGCTLLFPGAVLEPGQVSCARETRPFILQPFGSASLAIDEFQSGFRKVQLIVAGVVGIVAAVILMGMIGRIIADARKETAVFRALGASRLGIGQIYLVYTVYLAIFTAIIALLIGFALALWADSVWSADASIMMALLFNATDLTQKFYFYHFDLYDVGLIVAVIIIAAVVASLIPIASNVRRNPIKDMRED